MPLKNIRIRFHALMLFFNDRPSILLCFTILLTLFLSQILLFDNLISGGWSKSKLFSTIILSTFSIALFFFVSFRHACHVQIFLTALFIFLLTASLCSLSLFSAYSNMRKISEKVEGFTNKELSLEGVIVDQRGEYEYIFKPSQADLGIIYVKLRNFPDFQIGDRCKLEGKLVEPSTSKDFDYKTYLKKKKVFSFLEITSYECNKDGNILLSIRAEIENRVSMSIPEPEASLLIGILFGSNRVFTEKFENSIQKSGLSHIISASGYNVALILSMIDGLLYKSKGRVSILFKILLIWIFCIFAGFATSLVRASTMVSISLLSIFLGRRISKFYSLLLCITFLTLLNPLIIYDIGFLLSVFSTLGLIIFPKCFSIQNKFLKDSLLPTISCFLFTLPITVLFFKKISIISILSNLLVGPILEGTVYWGLFTVFLSNIFPNSNIIYVVPYLQLNVFKKIVNIVSLAPELSIERYSYVFSIVLIITLGIFCLLKFNVSEKNNYLIQSRRRLYGDI